MQIQKTNPGYDLQERRIKRKRQKNKKRLLRIRRFFVFLLFVTTITLLALSPLFNITDIEVRGNQHYKSDEIAEVIGLAVGSNAFKSLVYDYGSFDRLVKLRYGKTENVILDNYPYVKEVKAQYSIPGKVKIQVVERNPFAVITGQDVKLLVDREGYVLETVQNTEDSGYLLINGIEFQEYKPGQALAPKIGQTMRVLTTLLEAVEEVDSKEDDKLLPVINAVNMADLRNVRFFLDSRVTVNIGDVLQADDLNYRISYLKQIFFKYVDNQSKGHIDFSITEKPRFIPDVQ